MTDLGVHGSPPSRGRLLSYLYGPLTRFGLIVAALAGVVDQAVKLWLLFGFDLANRGIVKLTP